MEIIEKWMWCALFGPILFISALKLFNPSFVICNPIVVKWAEFIYDQKVYTK